MEESVDILPMKLNARQKWLIRATWEYVIAPEVGDQEVITKIKNNLSRNSKIAWDDDKNRISEQFYTNLFNDYPEQREFVKKRFNLRQTLEAIMDRLDVQDIEKNIQPLGNRHKSYGVEHDDYDIIGNNLIKTFKQSIGQKFTPEMENAWRCAWTIFSSAMKV